MHVITIKWNQHPLMMLIHLAGHCCGQKLAEKSDKDPREPNKEAKHIEPKLTAQLQKKSKGKVQWKR